MAWLHSKIDISFNHATHPPNCQKSLHIILSKTGHCTEVQQNTDLLGEYKKYWQATEIMPINVLGFQTHRDPVAIAYDADLLRDQVKGYLGRMPRKEDWQDYCRICTYRPFDSRYVYLGTDVTDRPRLEVVRHLFRENLALNLMRQTKANEWRHVLISNKPTPAVFVEIKDGSSIFPLYLYNDLQSSAQASLFDIGRDATTLTRNSNLSSEFITDISSRLSLKFIPDGTGDLKKTFGPEDVFNYIYAIFHCPTYRERYAEFLKTEFPRVPLTRNAELFRKLAAKGAELVALHLMESPMLKQPITEFVGKGDSVVTAGYPKYEKKTVMINAEQGFDGVPQAVWDFQIGGYQVCHKWLKDRRGRKLSAEDKTHYAKIVVALKETIRLMKEIDAAIPRWPVE